MWNYDVLGLLLVCVPVYIQCSGNCTWTVKSNQDQTEETGIHCVEYDSLSASSCQIANSDLPIPDDDANNIEAPSTFSYVSLMEDHNSSSAVWSIPRVYYKWSLPRSGSAKRSLKGFLINVICLAGPDCIKPDQPPSYCVMFDLRNHTFNNLDDYEFSWAGPLLNFSATFYQFELYSLPRTLQDRSVAIKYYADIKSAVSNGPVTEPAKWTTSIFYKISASSSVIVTFPFSKFYFTKYSVKLFPKISGKGQEQYVHFIQDSQIGTCTFEDVQTGSYEIRIEPYDELFNDDDKCRCYELNSNNNRRCRRCLISKTKHPFNVTNEQDMETTMSTSTHVRSSSASSSNTVLSQSNTVSSSSDTVTSDAVLIDRTGENDNIAITVGVVGGVIAIVIIALIIIFTYTRRCGQQDMKDNNNDKPNGHVSYIDIPDIMQKTVLVLGAEDHVHHVETVKQFVLLLQTQCMCNIIYPPWKLKEIGETSWKDWILKCLKNVDHVILVNSRASFELVNASKRSEMYNYKHLTNCGHLYLNMIQEVISDSFSNQTTDKYITVSFDYTAPLFVVPGLTALHHYKLTHQFPQLLKYIHQFQKDAKLTPELRNIMSPTQDLHENPLEQLNNAVTKAAKYEKSDVLWFVERFGDCRPGGIHRYDSGYDEQDDISLRNSSVSSDQRAERGDGRDEWGFFPPEDIAECVSVDMDTFGPPDAPDTTSHNNQTIDEDQSFIPPDSLSSFDKQSVTPSTYFRRINDNFDHLGNKDGEKSYDC